jgi:hypothetical protein
MTAKRRVEVFSAGCSVCQEAVELVHRTACSSCEVSVLDMKDASVAERAKRLGVHVVPAVLADGKLPASCRGAGPTEKALRAAGIGQPRV